MFLSPIKSLDSVLLAGAFTWQDHIVWLEREQKLMHYTVVPVLMLKMP